MSPKTRRKPTPKKSKTARAKAKKKTLSKKASPRRPSPAASRKAAARINPKEVEALLGQLQSEERSEKAWLEMTSPKPGEDDHWNYLEDNLAAGDQGPKRWKYFAK